MTLPEEGRPGALLLAMNVGSSSLKFAVARADDPSVQLFAGAADRLGADGAKLLCGPPDAEPSRKQIPGADHAVALKEVAAAIAESFPGATVTGIGHRIVHGGAEFLQPTLIDDSVLTALDGLITLAPLHQPPGLKGIRTLATLYNGVRQVACFDTAFHATKPWVHEAIALPERFYDMGLRRYGFHGLSCQSICRMLAAEGFPYADCKLVIAHMGNGCSATAVRDGKSIACSMGFSTLDGLAMGTRAGRVDAGAILHLLHQGFDVHEVEDLLYRRAGMLGLSGFSNDMRDLLASDDPKAARAIDFFVERAVEEISRMAGALRGLDTVVFCGGIGENAHPIRERICDGLAFLGPETLVRQTDEESEILLETARLVS
ncbi:MAG: acetate/propionate family kinase [Pseudomonadota bacterium]